VLELPPDAGTTPEFVEPKVLTPSVKSAPKLPPPVRGAVVLTFRVFGTIPPPPDAGDDR